MGSFFQGTARLRALVLVLLTGCGEASRPPVQSCPPASFGVIGRWEGELELTWAVEAPEAPEDERKLLPAVRAALAIWERTERLRFRPCQPGEIPDVRFAFRSGAHDDCPPFGLGEQLAHAGPTRPPSFVHFDAEREWSDGPGGRSLVHTAAHELGHVLGLAHSEDETALMYGVHDPAHLELTRSDLAGLSSLYGGGRDGPGDLVVERDGRRLLVLRGIAPADCTDYAVLDVDGNGRDEVLVWRTDSAGQGLFTVWFFTAGASGDDGPRLARTSQPLPGIVSTTLATVAGTTTAGDPVLVSWTADGRWFARGFDARGVPVPREKGRPFVLGGLVDADGDGVCDTPGLAAPPVSPRSGDLDGDGRTERVLRRD